MVLQECLLDFLAAVDSKKRDQQFLAPVLKCLEENEANDTEDLAMVTVDELTNLPKDALRLAFMRKASRSAETSFPSDGAATTAAGHTVDAAALSALLGKKDEKRIHVDMNAKLSSVSFVGITSFVTFERHIYYTLVVSPGLDPSL